RLASAWQVRILTVEGMRPPRPTARVSALIMSVLSRVSTASPWFVVLAMSLSCTIDPGNVKHRPSTASQPVRHPGHQTQCGQHTGVGDAGRPGGVATAVLPVGDHGGGTAESLAQVAGAEVRSLPHSA